MAWHLWKITPRGPSAGTPGASRSSTTVPSAMCGPTAWSWAGGPGWGRASPARGTGTRSTTRWGKRWRSTSAPWKQLRGCTEARPDTPAERGALERLRAEAGLLERYIARQRERFDHLHDIARPARHVRLGHRAQHPVREQDPRLHHQHRRVIPMNTKAKTTTEPTRPLQMRWHRIPGEIASYHKQDGGGDAGGLRWAPRHGTARLFITSATTSIRGRTAESGVLGAHSQTPITQIASSRRRPAGRLRAEPHGRTKAEDAGRERGDLGSSLRGLFTQGRGTEPPSRRSAPARGHS